MWPGYAGATTQIFRLLWIPKKILSKISSPQKIPLSSLSLEIQSTPPGGSSPIIFQIIYVLSISSNQGYM